VLAKRPDVVVIYIGVNDVWHKTTHGTGTDADKFEWFYKALIEKMTNAGIKVVLATPAGIGEKKNNANPQDADLNHYADIVRKPAGEHQLPLVDLRQLWQQYSDANNANNDEKGILIADCVHLNQTGNALVANAMLQVPGIAPQPKNQ
jgi:lysophospholipase L1-like esterase